MRWIIGMLFVLVPLAFLAGQWSASEDEAPDAEEALVRAQRYRIVWTDSALDLSHGGGRWVHEVYFPDMKVAATVVFEQEYGGDGMPSVVTHSRLHVWRADGPRNDLTGFHSEQEPTPSEITPIQLPADLAQQVADFARLADHYRAEGLRLGGDITSRLELEELGPFR